jgi:hypothetical protein
MKLANYSFPGVMVAGQALFYQFRIGGLQPSWLRPLPSGLSLGISPAPLTINGVALIKVSKYSGLSEIIAHL